MKLNECTNINLLREIVTYLYDLLDDIDTASDIAKSNDSLYRKMSEHIQQKKGYYLYSDGYNLFLEHKTDIERPKTLYEIFSEEIEK